MDTQLARSSDPAYASLDEGQCVLMRHLARDLGDKVIAEEMGLEEKDVRRRIMGLYLTLDVNAPDSLGMRSELRRMAREFAGESTPTPAPSPPPITSAPIVRKKREHPRPQRLEVREEPPRQQVPVQEVPPPSATPPVAKPTLAEQIAALSPGDIRRVKRAAYFEGNRGRSGTRMKGLYDIPLLPQRIRNALTALPSGVPRLHLRRAFRELVKS